MIRLFNKLPKPATGGPLKWGDVSALIKHLKRNSSVAVLGRVAREVPGGLVIASESDGFAEPEPFTVTGVSDEEKVTVIPGFVLVGANCLIPKVKAASLLETPAPEVSKELGANELLFVWLKLVVTGKIVAAQVYTSTGQDSAWSWLGVSIVSASIIGDDTEDHPDEPGTFIETPLGSGYTATVGTDATVWIRLAAKNVEGVWIQDRAANFAVGANVVIDSGPTGGTYSYTPGWQEV